MTKFDELVKTLRSIPTPLWDDSFDKVVEWKEKMKRLHNEFKLLGYTLSYHEEHGWVLYKPKKEVG